MFGSNKRIRFQKIAGLISTSSANAYFQVRQCWALVFLARNSAIRLLKTYGNHTLFWQNYFMSLFVLELLRYTMSAIRWFIIWKAIVFGVLPVLIVFIWVKKDKINLQLNQISQNILRMKISELNQRKSQNQKISQKNWIKENPRIKNACHRNPTKMLVPRRNHGHFNSLFAHLT